MKKTILGLALMALTTTAFADTTLLSCEGRVDENKNTKSVYKSVELVKKTDGKMTVIAKDLSGVPMEFDVISEDNSSPLSSTYLFFDQDNYQFSLVASVSDKQGMILMKMREDKKSKYDMTFDFLTNCK